ncbi:MFS transporter, NNP family, nitrate/nitrite transporter [Microbulbifer donghaiensis]|uniref:MFS transporter, NNP family, nitrate/nitrite transporter n=1 Tax=Microbulbifer donghaiensis TaxID=494016 RepID=A0A1M5G9M2_9GAMM|nr:MFS transporter [Microbulbifer donghaiensis]SHG00419.1 MFS transporter, NNP family, nitrate/nitrite transporter [Microbulbifer donghaiensis]
MDSLSAVSKSDQNRALSLSTIAFTACFAVWTIFSIIGIAIKEELGLSESQFGILVATPILTGSVTRLVLGIWTERYGGRIVFSLQMLVTAIATWLLTLVNTYPMYLLAALFIGLAGGSFIIGVTYVSRWYQPELQGTALGIFGAGNVGAAVTKFVAPFILVAYGWHAVAYVWAAGLALMAVIFYVMAKDEPQLIAQRQSGAPPATFAQQFEPLEDIRVWRFSLYYFFVFGGFVALALWMPHYLVDVYEVDLKTAGMAAASFSLSASLFRAYGGHLSDRYGARSVMYWTFGFSLLLLLMLSYPPTQYIIQSKNGPLTFSTEMGLWPFIVTLFTLGFFMSLGKAAIYKHIPMYYPHHVGSVGGLVGMIGGLGGFILPIIFGMALDLTGIYTSCFAILFAIVVFSFIWMHLAIQVEERRAETGIAGTVGEPSEIEVEETFEEVKSAAGEKVLEDWHPEDPAFWESKGRAIARRNLWISIPALLLAFAVWMVWSVVVARLPAIGFDFSASQLFWLAALPGLSGATLRIFYSFMVPIFGGRMWTTLSTASLLVPAIGMGYAVQDPNTPFLIFLILALLCGFGGGNFASSMANIAFFFPKKEKGHALAMNAGLGNLGVSVMQFLVPLVITVGVFGAVGGAPQTTSEGTQLWMQNAGFIWVPLIIASTAAAWFGMNDIADARSSFSDQAIIFKRKHNWLMCILYTGTFGSFIGYSAGFPLLTRLQFPEVDALKLVFLGPLVGALSRAGSGWVSDKYGGARVTFWTFLGMIIAVLGVIYFLSNNQMAGAFWGFFMCFIALFFLTGVGNASTFQMIPVIMGKEIPRLMPSLSGDDRQRQVDRESAAIIAFTSAIAAYGAFFIPKAYGTSIELTGGPMAALWGFLIFYAVCVVITWHFYSARHGMLYDVELDSGKG